jgi:hypothetical protein
MYGCMDEWMDGWMDVWMYGWMVVWMDGQKGHGSGSTCKFGPHKLELWVPNELNASRGTSPVVEQRQGTQIE